MKKELADILNKNIDKRFKHKKHAKYTIEGKVLKNVIEDMEKEVEIFEKVNIKDDDFYSDWANESYVLHLNSIARIKEVLFRMDINNKESV